jgi:alpha-ketoglutarate-dependent taurine dioxygenase
MDSDKCYTVDCTNKDTLLLDELRYELITNGYVKVKCENLPDEDCDKACLSVIMDLGGVCCPYDDDPKSLIWPVKVLELDTPESKLQASQLDRELVFHTDCSYEHNAPLFVALYVVQCDRTEHGGKFQMVRTEEIIDKLSLETQRVLRDETYKINVPPDFRKGDIDYICDSILLDGDKNIRYRRDIVDKNRLKEETAEKQVAIVELNSIILAEDQLNIFRPKLDNNMMVLFNNRRFLHGRTKIQDPERYLLRVRFNLI